MWSQSEGEWIEPDVTTLSKISQTQKVKYGNEGEGSAGKGICRQA